MATTMPVLHGWGTPALFPLGLLCIVLLWTFLGASGWWNMCRHLCWECVHIRGALCSFRTHGHLVSNVAAVTFTPAGSLCGLSVAPHPCQLDIVYVFHFSLAWRCVVLSSCIANLFAFLWWLMMLFVCLLAMWIFSFMYYPNLWLIFLFGC